MSAESDINLDHPTLQRLEALADLMDAKFKIPGIPIRFGIDALVGLIPVAGDTVNLSISGYIVFEAIRLGARKRDIVKMLFNIFLDWLIGLIPLIGDLFDVAWKCNVRNINLLKESLVKKSGRMRLEEKRQLERSS